MTMTMKSPPHPGLVVWQECIEPSGLTITQSAEALGVTRNTLFRTRKPETRHLARNGREALEGIRRHRGGLAGATGSV